MYNYKWYNDIYDIYDIIVKFCGILINAEILLQTSIQF